MTLLLFYQADADDQFDRFTAVIIEETRRGNILIDKAVIRPVGDIINAYSQSPVFAEKPGFPFKVRIQSEVARESPAVESAYLSARIIIDRKGEAIAPLGLVKKM